MECKVIGDGEPLVLLHGLGQRNNLWKHQEELSDTYQLIMPNLRGHGNSTNTENITLNTFAEDIIELLDELNIESAHIGGLSLGGVVAQALYRKAPHRVKSLILTNTTSHVPYFAGSWFSTQRVCMLSMMSNKEYIKSIVNNCLYHPTEDLTMEAMETFKINRSAYSKAVFAATGINYLPMLSRANVPIQVISSYNDMVTPYYLNGIYTYKWAKNAQSVVFDRTGHLSNMEKPEKFNQVVRDFLKDE